MSVCNVILVNGGEKAYIAADSRVATIINGEYYQLNDDAVKLQMYDGFCAYISGYLDIADMVSQAIRQVKTDDIFKIANITKGIYRGFLKENTYIKEDKHVIQVVIPIYQDNQWSVIFFDDQTSFEPMHIRAMPNENFVFGIGKGHWQTDQVIEKYLGKESIEVVLKKAFIAASSETCGGTLTYFDLDLKDTRKYSLKIPDVKSIKKYDDYFQKHCIGDGMTPTSGIALLDKYNGGLKTSYGQSNTGWERSIDLADSGIYITSEKGTFTAKSKDFKFIADQGSYQIGLTNGSIIELSTSSLKMDVKGNIDITATGTVTINGQQIKLN